MPESYEMLLTKTQTVFVWLYWNRLYRITQYILYRQCNFKIYALRMLFDIPSSIACIPNYMPYHLPGLWLSVFVHFTSSFCISVARIAASPPCSSIMVNNLWKIWVRPTSSDWTIFLSTNDALSLLLAMPYISSSSSTVRN